MAARSSSRLPPAASTRSEWTRGSRSRDRCRAGEGLDLNIGHYYGGLGCGSGSRPACRQCLTAGDGTDL